MIIIDKWLVCFSYSKFNEGRDYHNGPTDGSLTVSGVKNLVFTRKSKVIILDK